MSVPASPKAAYFETLFAKTDDPWRFRTLWYEARKRALTLASLPVQRYARGYEPGCANGELSAALAERCDHLLISDGNATAVAAARQRVAALPQVEVRQAWVPDAWPDDHFDLIVISELGYFLEEDALCRLAARTLTSLRPGGTVLACHWRRPIEGCTLVGDAVHRVLERELALPCLSQLVEEDFRIDVWCRDGRSVGTREGLR